MAQTKELLDKLQQAQQQGDLLESAAKASSEWLCADSLPAYVGESISWLIEQEQWAEINDRFYQPMKFGTGGMRGRTIGSVPAPAETGTPSGNGTPEHPSVGTNILNDFNLIKATIGLYRYCEQYLDTDPTRHETPKIVIAHDVRHFSRHFCELAASTWAKLGGKALIFDGPRSTPALSHAVRYLKSTAGVVITASHNPPHDNGFKAYFEDGGQVVSPHAENIIAQVQKVDLSEVPAFLEKDLSKVTTLPAEVDEAYIDALEENVIDPEVLQEYCPKVVMTPIHGTGAIGSLPALERFNITPLTVPEQIQQDPRFPTVKSPNPENAEALNLAIKKAEEEGADAVMATDPDCDRMGTAVRTRNGQMRLLTGNMIGSMLAEYRIRRFKELGILPANGTDKAALIKTFVTTPMQADIAKSHGLKVINTLTGFKWIGEKLGEYQAKLEQEFADEEGLALNCDASDYESLRELQLQYSTFYVFGGEESYGYLASDRVRDKDANAAVLMFCELGAWLKKNDLTYDEYLDQLYLQYGYYLENLTNIYMEGASGAAKIQNIIKSYRDNPPTEMGGAKVTKFTDFGKDDIHDADGKLIAKENFYFIELDNGYSYAARASGTEPKIKFYTFAREEVDDPASLPKVKEETSERLRALNEAIEADARQRAES